MKAVTAQAGQAALQDAEVKAVQAAVAAVMEPMDQRLVRLLAGSVAHLAELAVKAGSASSTAVIPFLTNRAEWAGLALCVLFGPDAHVHSHQLMLEHLNFLEIT